VDFFFLWLPPNVKVRRTLGWPDAIIFLRVEVSFIHCHCTRPFCQNFSFFFFNFMLNCDSCRDFFLKNNGKSIVINLEPKSGMFGNTPRCWKLTQASLSL
jgi:hypothetical protein